MVFNGIIRNSIMDFLDIKQPLLETHQWTLISLTFRGFLLMVTVDLIEVSQVFKFLSNIVCLVHVPFDFSLTALWIVFAAVDKEWLRYDVVWWYPFTSDCINFFIWSMLSGFIKYGRRASKHTNIVSPTMRGILKLTEYPTSLSICKTNKSLALDFLLRWIWGII